MEAGLTLEAMQEMLYFTMIAVVVIVTPGLIVGLIVAVFQAATQINEMTLSFLPKLLIVLFILALMGPWLLQQMTLYTEHLIVEIPNLIG